VVKRGCPNCVKLVDATTCPDCGHVTRGALSLRTIADLLKGENPAEAERWEKTAQLVEDAERE